MSKSGSLTDRLRLGSSSVQLGSGRQSFWWVTTSTISKAGVKPTPSCKRPCPRSSLQLIISLWGQGSDCFAQHLLSTLGISGDFSALWVLPLPENSRSQPPSQPCYLAWVKPPSLDTFSEPKIMKNFTSKNHQEFPLRLPFFSNFSWGKLVPYNQKNFMLRILKVKNTYYST